MYDFFYIFLKVRKIRDFLKWILNTEVTNSQSVIVTAVAVAVMAAVFIE